MTDTRTATLIVGAGPTGLGAAWRLSTRGETNWLLLDGATTAGGLAGSIVDDHGFTWDFGGHVQFSHYTYFDELMDALLGPGGWLHHERESWVWIRGAFVPYPFQLNLHRLPERERWECVRGLVSAARRHAHAAPDHFDAWIAATFGDGIARAFLRPYNAKVWAHPLEELSWSWIGDRVALVDLPRVVENIRLDRDDVSWGPNGTFRFPVRGGTGAVWRTLCDRLRVEHPSRVRLGQQVVAVDTASHVVTLASGTRVRYDALVSTMPLDRLIALSDLANTYGDEAGALAHSSTHVVGVGLHGGPAPSLAGKCWIYFPESDCPFYRVTVFSRYSPNNVPDISRYWSVMAEVSESAFKPVSSAKVCDEIVNGLISTRIIAGARQVHHVWHRRLEYGYPVPTRTRDVILDAIQPALEARGVFSRGRFGAWKYEVSNQDHSFAQGVEAIDRLLDDTPEETLRHPDVVNSRRSSAGGATRAARAATTERRISGRISA
jgi:protoporphyrinogen oxidase